MNKNLSTIEQDVSKKNWDIAYNHSIKLKKFWITTSNKISMFTNHNEIDIITNEINRLMGYIKDKDKGECYASVNTIQFSLKKIIDMEKISLKNIF